MHLWFLSKPETESGLLAGHPARDEAIVQASLLSMAMAKRVVFTTAGAVVAWSSTLLRAIERETERRRSIAALRALDNRMLRDMGIDRSEIVGVAEGRLHRQPASLAELRGLQRPGHKAAAPAPQSDDVPSDDVPSDELPDGGVSITQRTGRRPLPQAVPDVAATVSPHSPLRRYIGQARTGWL